MNLTIMTQIEQQTQTETHQTNGMDTNQIDLTQLRQDIRSLAEEINAAARLQAGDIFVLGCSSSEILGHHIGQASCAKTGAVIVEELLAYLTPQGIFLAVQGCEHINRALVVEREVQLRHGFEEVSVLPRLKAGGACAEAAYHLAADPVVIEHVTAKAGIDIGDTAIGMHVRFVQIPFRPSIKTIGQAHVTCLISRPKLIGGHRATYSPMMTK
jgi:uncharacterized protein (TIGR01440 family)